MSEPTDTKPKETKDAKEPKKGVPAIVGMLLSAVLAGGAAFGGTKAAAKTAGHAPAEHAHREVKPPGPTVALEPFLVNVSDEHKHPHPLKLTVAVEFEAQTKEDTLKPFTPRIRDAILAHMRTLTFEDASDSQKTEKLRTELLERCRHAGAVTAERVLITDMVTQ